MWGQPTLSHTINCTAEASSFSCLTSDSLHAFTQVRCLHHPLNRHSQWHGQCVVECWEIKMKSNIKNINIWNIHKVALLVPWVCSKYKSAAYWRITIIHNLHWKFHYALRNTFPIHSELPCEMQRHYIFHIYKECFLLLKPKSHLNESISCLLTKCLDFPAILSVSFTFILTMSPIRLVWPLTSSGIYSIFVLQQQSEQISPYTVGLVLFSWQNSLKSNALDVFGHQGG